MNGGGGVVAARQNTLYTLQERAARFYSHTHTRALVMPSRVGNDRHALQGAAL